MKDFQSQVFCLTGVIPGLARADVFDHIAARDGGFVDRMNKSVTILIVGERGQGTSKYAKAEQYGTEMMEYDEFMSWLFRTPIVDKDAHLVDLQRGSSKKYLGGAHKVEPIRNEELGIRNEELGIRNEELNAESEPTPTHTEEESIPHSSFHIPNSFDWSRVWDIIAAIFIILYKGLIVTAGISICVVLWLIGIPTAPPKV